MFVTSVGRKWDGCKLGIACVEFYFRTSRNYILYPLPLQNVSNAF
jgi:hypothetical protein